MFVLKKLMGVIAGILLFQAASSQVIIALLFGEKLNTGQMEFGLMLSPTFSNITGITSKTKTGFGLSLFLNFRHSEDLYFRVEASPKAVFGAKEIPPYKTGYPVIDSIYADGGTVERKIKALSLPLLIRYRISGLLFAEAGPQVNWMTKGKDIFNTERDENELDYTTEIREQLTKFDVGIAAGMEYKLKKDRGMGFGFRYYYGFTDIQKTPGAQHNSAWTLNVSIPVGAGKAAAKSNTSNN